MFTHIANIRFRPDAFHVRGPLRWLGLHSVADALADLVMTRLIPGPHTLCRGAEHAVARTPVRFYKDHVAVHGLADVLRYRVAYTSVSRLQASAGQVGVLRRPGRYVDRLW